MKYCLEGENNIVLYAVPVNCSGGCGYTFVDNPQLELVVLQTNTCKKGREESVT